MANANFLMSGVIGGDLTQATTATNFALGTRAVGNDGSVYQYCVSLTNITAYDCVVIDAANNINPINGPRARTAVQVGFAMHNWVAAGLAGWVRLTGAGPSMMVRAAISALPNVPLYTSDTVGVLTGTTATLSHQEIFGVALTVTAPSAGQPVTAVAAWPTVRWPNLHS